MHHMSKDFITAIIPPMHSDQKEVLREFFCSRFNVRRIEFFFVENPEIIFAHGAYNTNISRLYSRLRNSVGWQSEQRMVLVSCQTNGLVAEGEQFQLLTWATNNLEKKFPGITVDGVRMDSQNQISVMGRAG